MTEYSPNSPTFAGGRNKHEKAKWIVSFNAGFRMHQYRVGVSYLTMKISRGKWIKGVASEHFSSQIIVVIWAYLLQCNPEI